jgi:hypothetical protein
MSKTAYIINFLAVVIVCSMIFLANSVNKPNQELSNLIDSRGVTKSLTLQVKQPHGNPYNNYVNKLQLTGLNKWLKTSWT